MMEESQFDFERESSSNKSCLKMGVDESSNHDKPSTSKISNENEDESQSSGEDTR